MTEVRAGYPIHINDSVHDQRCDGCQRPIEPGESYGKRHGIVFCLRCITLIGTVCPDTRARER
jgi:hypothetical protein